MRWTDRLLLGDALVEDRCGVNGDGLLLVLPLGRLLNYDIENGM